MLTLTRPVLREYRDITDRAMRKKLKDMTPWKRVEKRLQGLTNEEAEGIAFRILGQTTAKRIYVEGEDFCEIAKEYGKRHVDAMIEYRDSHSFSLAVGRVLREQEQENA